MRKYYSKFEIEKAREVDLLTYLKSNEPDELVYIDRNTYATKEHDSLRISNGKWYWFSRGFGGGNAIDYLVKVKGLPFIDAVHKILKVAPKINYNVKRPFTLRDKINRLIIPEKNDNNYKIINYLKMRGIDENIIKECIDKELIYEDINHNVCFVGLDEDNNIRYVGARGTGEKRFMMEASGSDKTYSFRLISDDNSDTIHLFESAIDLLSYATYLENKGMNWHKNNLIALAGVYQTSTNLENSKVPIALKHFLEHNNIKKIYIHFDNDRVGRNATKALKIILSNKYEIIDSPPLYGKDYNDFLLLEQKEKYKNNYIKLERER